MGANGFELPYLFPSLVADDNMLGIVAELWSRLGSKAMGSSTARLCACGRSDGVEKAQLHLADSIAADGLMVVSSGLDSN